MSVIAWKTWICWLYRISSSQKRAQLADVVLPAACWGEKDGTYTNTTRTVQMIRKAVEAPGSARPDWEILTELAQRLGAPWDFTGPSEVFDAIAEFTPSYAGMGYERLEKGPLSWPCPSKDHPGTPILHTSKFARPNGKGYFVPCEWKAPHEWPDEDIPSWPPQEESSTTITREACPDAVPRESSSGELYIEVNPVDAHNMKVSDEDMIRVTSRRGSVEGKVKVTDRVPPKMVFLPFHFSEARANLLTAAAIDPDSETPAYKVSAVKVEKV